MEDVILSIRNKGLKRLYEDDEVRGIMAEHAGKLRDIPARLDAASNVEDMDLPSSIYMRSKVTGRGTGLSPWARIWRVVFRFEEGAALDVDYVDYH